MNDTLTLQAPAKLNLFLRITGRRDDGYHNLQTVFQLLDFADTLHFRLPPVPPRALLSLRSTSAPMEMENNLILRAARLLREFADRPQAAAEITLEKRIPVGAGLGGGSADAAATLVALNRLWDTGLTEDELTELSLRLGADVPVFTRGLSAWAEGVGERLHPVSLPSCWYLVVTPPCSVSTAAIFSHQELTRNSPAITIADFLPTGARIAWDRAGNDCEALVCRLYPEVRAARDWLRTRKGLTDPGQARLTGTGASVFAPFGDQQSAAAALAQLPAGYTGFVARGMARAQWKQTGWESAAVRPCGNP